MIAGRAEARLGETVEECTARYGNVISIKSEGPPDFPQYCFRKGDVEIRVRFLNKISGQEIFYGAEDGQLSESEVSQILTANKQGSTWGAITPTRQAQDKEHYAVAWMMLRSDGLARAQYVVLASNHSNVLTIETVAFLKAWDAKASGF